ncbi:MAG: PaREP1 family protein [Candidatus Verstraetearchaeota archaeon]|nr:PaREP1 family protein [Candidatus Verstraetearchaeota archaeon]
MIILPKKIEEKLKEESKRIGISEEELILEALSKILNEPIDPETKIEMHLKLSEKYLKDAEDFLVKKDYVQASEKAWGAASQIVKALAMKEGIEVRSHGELHKYITELSKKREDKEIITLWFSAISLHQNFYENWLPEEAIKSGIENVRKLIEKLRKLL